MESAATPIFRTSPEVADLAAALAKAQAAIGNAREDSKNPHFKAAYASLTACWAACREPLAANGLAVVQGLATHGRAVICTTRLLHASGQWVESVLAVPSTKDSAQGIGSAATYARRYALCGLVGIAPAGDDDDGQASAPKGPSSGPQGSQDPGRSRWPARATSGPTAQSAPNGPKEPPAPKHDPSFAAERRPFMIELEKLGWKYAELCRFLATLDKPRPSAMDSKSRAALLRWLPSDAARPVVAEFLHADDQRPLAGAS